MLRWDGSTARYHGIPSLLIVCCETNAKKSQVPEHKKSRTAGETETERQRKETVSESTVRTQWRVSTIFTSNCITRHPSCGDANYGWRSGWRCKQGREMHAKRLAFPDHLLQKQVLFASMTFARPTGTLIASTLSLALQTCIPLRCVFT